MNIYHYTKLDALKGILNPERKELTFWGTRYDSMNDPQDYIFASKVVLPKMLQSIEEWEGLDEEGKEFVEEIPYIVSFTENRDSDFMWKHYNAEVSLEMDSSFFDPYLREKDSGTILAFFDKCTYINEEEIDDAFIQKWKDSPVYLDNMPSMTQHVCAFIKRDAFKEENEWRLYSTASKLPVFAANGEEYIAENSRQVRAKCVYDHDIVLYMEFNIPAEALKGIIVNDVNVEHYHKVKEHIKVLLSQKGINPDKVEIRQTGRYPL